ncbi:MAG: VWA domain-containing protein [Methylobacter sp.]|uniref:vWA domain-containing protein n=1 Tax=Methylobacter sp. TaxID=2051955 RepID=UPI00272FEB0C|nr:VWA domain-containing protein [Methylobacter sp.]MDP1664011.1 VWA domain-containing protein [Methylobacter sp.]
MIHFEWPWLLAALPLPLLIRWLVPAKMPVEQAALKVPFLEDFSDGETRAVSQTRQWPLLLAAIAWLLLVIACTRPQWLGEPIEQAVSGRDLMLAVDLSGSMEEQDFVINKRAVDRLTAAKGVAGEFINRRVGDRVGLILFGTQAYLQTPLTFDRKTVMTLLNEAVIGLAGDNTAIGDAIGLAVKRLKNEQTNSRVLVLMTDGANTAGEISPLKAAELAADNHLKIYTIGIGADEMIVRSFFGNRKVNPSVDLDEKTLIKIAESTGGQYYRARNTDELNNIYMRLDELEPVEKDKQYFRPRSELYYWPLSLALALAAVIALSKVRLT